MSEFDELFGSVAPAETVPEAPLAGQPIKTEDSFDGFFEPVQKVREQQFRMSVRKSLDTTPDKAAAAKHLSTVTGLPLDMIERNYADIEKQVQFKNISEAARKYPEVYNLFTDPHVVKIARDDVGALNWIADRFRVVGGSGIVKPLGSTLSGLGELNDNTGRTIMRSAYSVMEAAGLGDVAASIKDWDARAGAALPWWLNPSEILRRPGTNIETLGKQIDVPQDRRIDYLDDALSGAGQVGTQILAAIATGGNSLVPALMAASQSIDMQADRAREAGTYGTVSSDTGALLSAPVTAIMEKFQVDRLLNRLPPNVKSKAYRAIADLAIAGGTEAVQEVAEGVVLNFISKALIDPKQKIFEGLDTDAAGGFGGGFFGRALVMALNKGQRVRSAGEGVEQAQADTETLRQLMDAADQSQTKVRDPDTFKSFIKGMAANAGAENVHIPAEKFVEYFQSINVDPLSLGIVDEGDLDSALANGGDIQIPIEAYLTDLDRGTQDGLMNYVRLNENSMTLDEAESWYANIDEVVAQEEQRISEELARDAEERGPIDRVYSDVREQLIAANRSPEVADKEARTAAARYSVRARLRGVDAYELYREKGYQTVRELNAPFKTQPIDNIDMYIAEASEFYKRKAATQARAEAKPSVGNLFGLTKKKREKATPRPMVRYLMNKGGIDPQGFFAKELAAMDITPKNTPRLFRKGGLGSLDTIPASEFNEDFAEYDVSAPLAADGTGYVDPQFIYDLLRDEASGSYLRNEKQRNDEAKEQGFDEFRSLLARYGLDVDSDPAEIKEALRQYRAETAGDLYQDGQLNTESEAFKAWFGDSKVVDENGKPLVVYHGSAYSVSSLTDAGDRGVISFAFNPDRASGYAGEVQKFRQDGTDNDEFGNPPKDSGAQIYPVYLSVQNPFDYRNEDHIAQIETHLTDKELADARSGSWEVLEEKLHSRVENLGFDGIYTFEDGELQIGVFRPTQIKSIHNRGTFDPNDARILYQDGDYRIAHRPPTPEGGAPLYDLTGDGLVYPDDVYSAKAVQYYGHGDRAMDQKTIDILQSLRGKPDAKVKIYRASEKGVPSVINSGDWVTVNRDYAIQHGQGFEKGFQIVEMEVSAKELFTNGDSIHEAGYWKDGKADVSFFQGEDIDGSIEAENIVTEYARKNITPAQARNKLKKIGWGVGPDGFRGKYDPIELISPTGEKFVTYGQDTRNSPRGSFTPESRIIRLFDSANLSTFVHESGHAWLEEMREDAAWVRAKLDGHRQSMEDGFPGGRLDEGRIAELEKFADDYDKLLKYVGAEAGQPFTREQHEKFARTVEAYFMTGKAPSVELQPVFQRFKAWLTAIYNTVKNLNVNLNPEITGVLDRMLATEQEIADAERAAKMEAIAIEGATPDEQARLDRLHRAATDESDRRLLVKAMEPVRREREKWYKEEWRKTADEVQAELEDRPEWRALALTRGSEDVDPVKMDLRALEDEFGTGIRSLLPRGVTSTKSGAEPIVVAEAAGFADVRSMVEALGGIRGTTLKKAVKAETDARMRDKHGDVMNDGTIESEAQAAIHNEKRGDAIAQELKILRRLEAEKVARRVAERRVANEGALDAQTYASEAAVAETGIERLVAQETGKVARFARSYDRSGRQRMNDAMEGIDPKAIREAARRAIGKMKSKDLGKTAQYSRAEVKAAEASRKAIAARDYEQASFYKYRQLLNHYLFIEAKKAQQEADTMTKYLGRLASKKTIATLDQDYLEQIHGLLEKFDFKRASQKEVERRKSFADWIAEQQAGGRDIVAPQKLIDQSQLRHYSDVPLDDLRALRDTVRQIENLGRMKQKIKDAQEERDYQEAISEVVETIEGNKDKIRRSSSENKTGWDRFFSTMRSADAQLLKIEQVIDWLDGGNPNGPLNRMVFDRLSKAQAQESDMTVKYVADLEKIMSSLDPARMQQRLTISGKYDDQGRQVSYTRADLMAVALNMGNDENMFRLTAKKGNDFSDAQLLEVTKHLNAQEAQAVQDAWDLINTLWPQIAELERSVNGVAPPKVEAREFTMETADGPVQMRGGYYPIVYNPEKDIRAGRYADKAAAALFDESSYVRANTQQGHAKERMEGIAKPLRLDIDIIPRHLSQVIHDIAFREAIIDTNRVLSDPRVTKAVHGTLGKEYHDQFRPWLKAIANDRNLAVDQEAGVWSSFLRRARTNTTVVAMGFRFTTMFSQIAGLSAGAEMIGGKWMGVGMKEVYGDPSRIGEVMQAIRDESGEMRHRHNQIDRDMRDANRRIMGQGGFVSNAQRWAFAGIALFDRGVATAVYMGAKAKAISEGMTPDQAIAYAEKAVRLTQSAGGTKDLSAIQRGHEGLKLVTMFYSYFNVMYARMRDIGRTTVQEKDYADAFFRSFWLLLVPSILGELLTGKGPGDDEDLAKWAAGKIATYPFAAIPLGRDIASAVDSGYGYKFTPATRGGETVLKPIKTAAGILEGKDVDAQKAIMSSIEAAGYVIGLPTGQVTKSANYLWDVLDGDQRPDDILEFARGVTIGPKKN